MIKLQKYISLASILSLLVALSGTGPISVLATPSVPEVGLDRSEVPVVDTGQQRAVSQPIIIDHTTTDLSQIPDYWIEQAKKLAIHYAHTSHGSQVRAYLPNLEALNPLYDFSAFYAGSSPPTSLSACETGALCLYDGNPPETYIQPDDYWESMAGRDRTRSVANTGLFNFSMWSWCGQASYYSTAQIQQYLDTMAQLEAEYPSMRFILMTGHTDGGTNQTLIDNNNLIRQFAQDHGMVLFDFADIESYDPDGNYYPYTTDACAWCSAWCATHPEDCQDLPSCAHSHGFNCKLKGYAFWWMMARLAGWDAGTGIVQKTASSRTPVHGDVITYSITIGDISAVAQMTDTVPESLSYIPGTLIATSGTITDTTAPVLGWTGDLSATASVTITYAVDVDIFTTQAITNMATVTAVDHQPITSTATIIANGYPLYLTVILKE